MPRPPRLHVPGAHYHVILRGNHREALFGRSADRCTLNDIISRVRDRLDFRVHAFCWMTNHLHMLVQVADRPLGEIMQRIAVSYSRYRHKVLRTSGHLFERRYKAKLVEVDTYFWAVVRYIHMNPVKARMATDPAAYPWSSHCAYLGLQSIPWLTTQFGLSMLSSNLLHARAVYRRFMLAPAADAEDLDDESHPEDPRILGTDRFISSIRPIPYRSRSSATLEQFANALCRQHGITVQYLQSPSRSRKLTPVRVALATQAVERRLATLSDIARFLHRDPSALTRLLARAAKRRRAG
jgi:REP-associated tyrosine transposase